MVKFGIIVGLCFFNWRFWFNDILAKFLTRCLMVKCGGKCGDRSEGVFYTAQKRCAGK